MTKVRVPSLLAALAAALFLTSCFEKKEPAPAATAAAASAAPKVINLAIWSNYISPETLADFEKRTGITVKVSNYASNEELLAKIQAGASGYDVVVPSDYMVFAMSKLGLIRELDYSKLSNSRALDPRFLKKGFDPQNKFSVPYDWGTTGIAINRSLYKGELKGWKNLFGNADLAGKFTLLDDVRETIGAALKSQGLSLNTTKADELAKAKDVLMKARSRIKAFNSETLAALVNGESPVAHAYASDALQARKQTGGKIEYIIPIEGATLWIDNLVVPAAAPHPEEAHAFINFLLEARTNAATVMATFVSPANKDVFALLPKDLQEDPVLFPPQKTLDRLEMLQDLGEGLAAWDRIWTEVKVQ